MMPSCPAHSTPEQCTNDDINIARQLDYGHALDIWVRDYAWPVCQGFHGFSTTGMTTRALEMSDGSAFLQSSKRSGAMTPVGDDGLIPCSAAEAVARMLQLEADRGGQYLLGTGGYDPRNPLTPWTPHATPAGIELGGDCAGVAISFAYRLCRHRPGFNRQMHATVEDDLNCDSVLEDADPERGGRQELGEVVTVPQPGDLLITPSIRIPSKNFRGIGHVRLILDASRWNPAAPRWADVVYLECHGPNGHKPGVTRAPGGSVDIHDANWPKLEHRAALVRIRHGG